MVKHRSDSSDSAYDSTSSFTINWKLQQVIEVSSRSGRTKPLTKHESMHCEWFFLPLLLPTPTIWFSLDHKGNVSDDSSDSDSVALIAPLTTPIHKFSLGHKRSYDHAYDSHSNSDSVASENQPFNNSVIFEARDLGLKSKFGARFGIAKFWVGVTGLKNPIEVTPP